MRRQQSVSLRGVAGEVGIGNFVSHLGREQIETVVAAARFAGEFLNGHQLDTIHTQISQVVYPIQYVEELGDAGSLIIAERIDCIEDADVQLVKNQIAELRRSKLLVMPRVHGGRSHQAIGRWKVGRELTSARIAL